MDDDQDRGTEIKFYNTTEMGLREEKPFLVMRGKIAEDYKRVQKSLDNVYDLLEEMEKAEKKRKRKREREEEDDDDEERESPFHGAEREGEEDDEDDYEKSLDDGDFDPDFEEDDDPDFDDEDLDQETEGEIALREFRKEAVATLSGARDQLEEAVDASELEMGIEIELEHTKDREEAKRIALEHLLDVDDYYTRLIKMLGQAKKEGAAKSLDNMSLMESMRLKGWFPRRGVLRDKGVPMIKSLKVRSPSEIAGNLEAGQSWRK